ncbi:PucR family transcriptional regulator [Bifidobacterium longum]
MTVSIRSVLHNTQFKRADPVVEVEGKDLDMPVRWVFTNEREDVSSFLSGGEMLIIEGNALLAADWHGTLGQYVASLAQAGVAALVVELVEGVVRMPDELVSAARLHGLTLIGLKSRVPFVDICQSVNTAIVHEQMHLQLEVDTMSTSLREGLSRTGNIEAVAETIASLFGESVAIFDGDGLLAARAGRAFDAGNESSAVIALESRSRPVGALEITQRTMTFDATMRRAIATIVSPVAALYIDGGARMGMMHHLSMGPADGVHVNTFEAQEAHAMLERFEELSGCAVSCMLEGDLMVGWCSTTDSSDGAAAFGRHCMDALAVLEGDGIYVVHGRVALDTVTLVDGFAVLRDIANHEPAYGRVVSTMSALVDRFVASSDMDKAMRMLVVQTIGFEVAASPLLLDTLCACFDNLDSKTGACEQLGIRRQTLYNRLDKVTQMVGVDYNDKPNWSMLLFAAKLTKSWQEQHGE